MVEFQKQNLGENVEENLVYNQWNTARIGLVKYINESLGFYGDMFAFFKHHASE